MSNETEQYINEICPIPEFLNKYLDLDILSRLHDVSYFCGMDYASPYAYQFKYYISRYDHSLTTALITWRYTHDKESTLAALFHDIATPVFSHVIDYMNGDYVNQESTEEKTYEILSSSKQLKKCLEEDNISLEDIADFKNFSIVDLDRPKMCADRLDGIITTGASWAKLVDETITKHILDDITVVTNEDGEEELAFKSKEIASSVTIINNRINELTHTNEDTYMMMLLSKITKHLLKYNYITYDELFTVTEDYIINMIEILSPVDTELDEYYTEFTTIKQFPKIDLPTIKDKQLNPLVQTKRLKNQ